MRLGYMTASPALCAVVSVITSNMKYINIRLELRIALINITVASNPRR